VDGRLMVQINFAKREINCKLVYYGPGLSGKTTNLEVVHKKAPASKKGELTSIATEGDRTLFFDYMPLELGKVGGMNTKFQLYTVPGQVYYNATRKLVLQGADGVVFVADSQADKMEENLESFANLEENLREQGLDPKTIPMVLQWNKRDLPNVLTVDELDKKMNKYNSPTFEAIAVTGDGVFPTLKKLAQIVLEKLNREYGLQSDQPGGGGPGEKKAGTSTSSMPKSAAKADPTPPRADPPPKAERQPGTTTGQSKKPVKQPDPPAEEEEAPPPPPSKRPKMEQAASREDRPERAERAERPERSKPEKSEKAEKEPPREWKVVGANAAPEPAKGGKGKLIAVLLLLVLGAVGGFVGAGFKRKLPPVGGTDLQAIYDQHVKPIVGGE
jgi:signal recognition particle receptor subunit beta